VVAGTACTYGDLLRSPDHADYPSPRSPTRGSSETLRCCTPMSARSPWPT